LDRRLFFPAVGAAITLLLLSTLILSARLQDSARDLRDSVTESVYAENIAPTDASLAGLLTGSTLESQFYRTVLPNSMYYLSGAYEFSLLWTRPDSQPFAFGGYMFSPFAKVFRTIFGLNQKGAVDEESLVYRTGVFNTFFGPVWVDFGWFGLIFCAFFGIVATSVGNTAKAGNFSAVPLYLYIVVIVFYMPVVNFITTGYGIFAICSFGIFALATSSRGVLSRRLASHSAFASPVRDSWSV